MEDGDGLRRKNWRQGEVRKGKEMQKKKGDDSSGLL